MYGRYSGKKRGQFGGVHTPLADINMTPFIDVMMVLLIIFMVTAPLMTVGVKVDLPKAEASEIRPETEPVTITVDSGGTIYLGEKEVAMTELISRLNLMKEARAKTLQSNEAQSQMLAQGPRVFLRGDRAVAYGQIMKVMNVLTNSGFTRIAMIAERQ